MESTFIRIPILFFLPLRSSTRKLRRRSFPESVQCDFKVPIKLRYFQKLDLAADSSVDQCVLVNSLEPKRIYLAFCAMISSKFGFINQ